MHDRFVSELLINELRLRKTVCRQVDDVPMVGHIHTRMLRVLLQYIEILTHFKAAGLQLNTFWSRLFR